MLPTREISCKNQDLKFRDGEGSSKSFAASRTRMFSLMFFFLFALAPAKVQLRATGSSEPVTGECSPGPGRSPRPAAPAGSRLHAAPLRATFALAGGAASCPQHQAAACRSGPGAARGRPVAGLRAPSRNGAAGPSCPGLAPPPRRGPAGDTHTSWRSPRPLRAAGPPRSPGGGKGPT